MLRLITIRVMINLNNVSKTFDQGKTYAVRDVSLDVPGGETLVILGSSGSGKSTLLKLINRLIEMSSGEIHLDGHSILEQDTLALRRAIGYVFQGVGLFPHMSVEDNIAIMHRITGQGQSVGLARAHELLNLVNLSPGQYAKRFPEELSGGQQQRVGVARALALDPDYLLMDEPFGAVDAITRDTLQEEVLRLNGELHKTIIFVTHDVSEALRLGDRIAIMHKGQLQQIGPKEDIIKHPATDFVAELFAKSNQQYWT